MSFMNRFKKIVVLTAAAISVSDFKKVFPHEPFGFIPSGKTKVFVCIE